MAITYALMQRFEELAEKEPERIQLIKKAKVVKVNKDGNKATGVTYTFNDEEVSVEGPVILATGGYAADFGEDSLLKKHRPDTFDLASTNGTHATGDGHKMLMAMGANDIDMDKVQVHPTGLVDPKDPGSKWKFLAAEGVLSQCLLKKICANNTFKLYVVRVVSFSTRTVNASLMNLATVTTSRVRCGRRRKRATGLFAWCSIRKPQTSWTSILVTTLDVV